MSTPGRKHDVVLRRRVRTSQYIEIPEAVTPPRAPGIRDRAKRFALILIAIMFVGGVLLATPLTTRSGERTPSIDAFFTSVSAVSVTGLVAADTQTHWNSAGLVIILVLIQIGGLGFMVGAGILFQLSRGGRTTLNQSLIIRDGSPSITLQEAMSLSRQIALFTIVVEAIGWAVLTAAFWREMSFGRAVWHGLFHSVSAFCNAGFDLQGTGQSLTGYRDSWVVNVVMALLVLAGALSFLVVRESLELLKSVRSQVARRPVLSLDAKLVLSGNLVVFCVGFLAMLALEWNGMLSDRTGPQRVLGAGFQALAGRTAGFSTVDWSEANSITQFIWLAMMMVGGASGSTTGGVKIATVAVIFVAVLSTFRGDDETEAFKRRIPTPLLMRSMSIVAAFLLLHFLGTIALAMTEYSLGETNTQLNNMLFESMSGLATTGLTIGITEGLSDVGKVFMCVLMFVGRLGPLTLGYALQMRTHPRNYRFPAGDVRIG